MEVTRILSRLSNLRKLSRGDEGSGLRNYVLTSSVRGDGGPWKESIRSTGTKTDRPWGAGRWYRRGLHDGVYGRNESLVSIRGG